MVAEGTFGPADTRRDVAHERHLRRGHEGMRTGTVAERQLLPGDERGQHQLGNVLGQRRHRGQHDRRRPAQQGGDGEVTAHGLGRRVMEAAALADLPVHARRARSMDLHPVDPEVVAAAARVLGVDEGQGHEGAAVLRPAGQDGQAVETDVGGHDLGHGTRAAPARPDAQRLARQVPRGPQLAGRGRQEGVRELDQP